MTGPERPVGQHPAGREHLVLLQPPEQVQRRPRRPGPTAPSRGIAGQPAAAFPAAARAAAAGPASARWRGRAAEGGIDDRAGAAFGQREQPQLRGAGRRSPRTPARWRGYQPRPGPSRPRPPAAARTRTHPASPRRPACRAAGRTAAPAAWSRAAAAAPWSAPGWSAPPAPCRCRRPPASHRITDR